MELTGFMEIGIRIRSIRTQQERTYNNLWGSEAAPDISGFATLAGNKSLQVLIYHHHDDWDLSQSCEVTLEIEHLPFATQNVTLQHYRIDPSHSNAYSEWVRQGKPIYPPPGQLAAIKARDGLELLHAPQSVTVGGE